MEKKDVLEMLGGLSQETRLDIYRLLVEQGPDGLPAGRIAARLDLAPATASFHLANLERSGLLSARRTGRSIIYSADFEAMNALMAYLSENCCRGSACCAPDPESPALPGDSDRPREPSS